MCAKRCSSVEILITTLEEPYWRICSRNLTVRRTISLAYHVQVNREIKSDIGDRGIARETCSLSAVSAI